MAACSWEAEDCCFRFPHKVLTAVADKRRWWAGTAQWRLLRNAKITFDWIRRKGSVSGAPAHPGHARPAARLRIAVQGRTGERAFPGRWQPCHPHHARQLQSSFGLEKLTGGALAFINCTEESLTDELVDVLPASMTVLEILEDLEPTPVLVSACRRLKRAGFRLALDDFTWKPGIEPLVELPTTSRSTFSPWTHMNASCFWNRLSYRAVALVAEKVETREQFKTACDEGFTLVQGYHFCRPVMLRNRKIPANRLSADRDSGARCRTKQPICAISHDW